MKIKTIVKAVITASLFTAAGAQAYQVELNGNYKQYSADKSDTDTDVVGFNAKYYIDPVRVGSNPHQEAAFLAKSNNIGLAYAKSSVDGSDDDNDVIGLGGEMYLKQSPLYLAAHVAQVDNADDEKDEVYSAKIGYLPSPTLRLTAGLVGNSDDTDPTLGMKYVGSAENTAFNLEADLLLADDTGFNVSGDIYLDPTLSLGVSFSDKYAGFDNLTGADSSVVIPAEKVVGINAKKFLTPQFAVGVNYAKGEVGNNDIDGFGFELTGRF